MRILFNNNESAIGTIVDSAQKHSIASENGDFKTANKNYDLIKKAVEYLRKHNGIDELKGLLTHTEISVKIAASSYLLKHFEREAVKVLEEIANKSIPHKSFDAKMILQEWKKGNLDL